MTAAFSASLKSWKAKMPWNHRTHASIEGDSHVNEDTAGFAGDIAWVIDGATPLWDSIGLPAASDPAWYAREFARLLAETDLERVAGQLKHDGGVPTSSADGRLARGVLRDALARMDALAGSIVGEERELFPSAAVTIALSVPGGIEVAALADCQAVILGGAGASDLGGVDQTVQHFGSGTWDRTSGKQTSLTSRPAEERERLTQERRDRNKPGTVWVARREPEAADHARAAFFPGATGVVLASDGAWRAVELGIVDVPGFATAASAQPGLTNLLAELRNVQWDRGEGADDTTVLAVDTVLNPTFPDAESGELWERAATR